MLDWAALNAVCVACPDGDMVPARPRRHDDAAVAVVEDDVGAVGLGEAWRGLEEFLGIHSLLWIDLDGGRNDGFMECTGLSEAIFCRLVHSRQPHM